MDAIYKACAGPGSGERQTSSFRLRGLGTGWGYLFLWEKNSLCSDTFSRQKRYPHPMPGLTMRFFKGKRSLNTKSRGPFDARLSG